MPYTSETGWSIPYPSIGCGQNLGNYTTQSPSVSTKQFFYPAILVAHVGVIKYAFPIHMPVRSVLACIIFPPPIYIAT